MNISAALIYWIIIRIRMGYDKPVTVVGDVPTVDDSVSDRHPVGTQRRWRLPPMPRFRIRNSKSKDDSKEQTVAEPSTEPADSFADMEYWLL